MSEILTFYKKGYNLGVEEHEMAETITIPLWTFGFLLMSSLYGLGVFTALTLFRIAQAAGFFDR